jgi:hypothetical protein
MGQITQDGYTFDSDWIDHRIAMLTDGNVPRDVRRGESLEILQVPHMFSPSGVLLSKGDRTMVHGPRMSKPFTVAQRCFGSKKSFPKLFLGWCD